MECQHVHDLEQDRKTQPDSISVLQPSPTTSQPSHPPHLSHLNSKVLGGLPYQPRIQLFLLHILVLRIQLAQGGLSSHDGEKGVQQGWQEAILQQGLKGKDGRVS